MAESVFIDPSTNGVLPISGTTGALLYWASSTSIGEIPDVATGQVLASGGTGTVPAYTATPSVQAILVGAGSVGTPPVRFSGDPDNGLYYIGTNNWGLSAGGTLIQSVETTGVGIGGVIRLGNTATSPTSYAYLYPDAADTLALRNGTSAQTLNIYNTYTSASNYEKGTIAFESNVFRISTSAATGTVRNIGIRPGTGGVLALGSDGATRWEIGTGGGGNLLASADNTYDIGASGATRPRTVYVGTRVQAPTLQSTGVAFGSLPSGVAGMIAYVTDSNTATWGATIAGGGANKVLAWYNGTNWTVAGA